MPNDTAESIVLDGQSLTWSAIASIADGAPVRLHERLYRNCTSSRKQLERAIGDRRLVYGVTTGYGALADRFIDPGEASRLQRNLVYHLASGTGPELPAPVVRAIMAVRLQTLALGHSAVRWETLERLAAWLNDDLVPLVPARGTVGASGDLTPLAHVALALMGEAEVRDRGRRRPARDALVERGWQAMDPAAKDGLALVNGTAAMTGIASLNARGARRAADMVTRITVAVADCLNGRTEAWQPEISAVRPHPGQQAAQRRLLELADSSRRLRTAIGARLADTASAVGRGGGLPQDPYTLRCAPQLLGAVLDVLAFHDTTVDREINAVTDNPVFFPDTDRILHGGNFYGQHVAFASDALVNALVKLGIQVERLVARITDETRNGALPAFLQGRDTGINSGFMGAQVSASALVAEMRSLAHPASIQAISTNADNQDVNTMGTIAARKAARVLECLEELLAIGALVAAQAIDLSGKGFGTGSRVLRDWVRESADFLEDDRPLYRDIGRLAERLRVGDAPDSP